MVYRIYVEKKPGFDGEAQSLRNELVSLLGIKELNGLRLLNRYDVEGIDEALFEQCVPTVFSEPPVDNTYAELPASDGVSFAVEYLPGQFDQRADSAAECIQLISQGDRPLVRSARVYLLEGTLSDEQVAEIKKYVINPVEAREASLDTKQTLKMEYPVPAPVKVLEGFNQLDEEQLKKFIADNGLAMDLGDIEFCQKYFRSEHRDPTITEIKMIDTYWSDHCRHTTFGTILDDVQIDDAVVQKAFDRYMAMRADLGRENKPRCMMDLATIGAKELKKQGILKNLDESDEINACTVKIKCDVNGKEEDWLFLFKNETHNHPTAISPFPGASTGSGGEIRDEGATGRGARPKAGLCGFTTSNLNLPELPQGFENDSDTVTGEKTDAKYGAPSRIATPLSIMTEGPLGGAAFNNEFGRPNILGYFRTFEANIGGTRYGYHKPIMLAGGIGNIRDDQTKKDVPPAGSLLIVLGGPGMRIGLGGGAASSMTTGSNSEALDFDSVQRGNPEMERRAQEVIDRCWSMGDENPIIAIHDVGAGGLSNAMPELADLSGKGATFDLSKVPVEESGMSPLEIWCNESQERYVIALDAAKIDIFRNFCERERCPFAVLGTITEEADLKLTRPEETPAVDMPMEVLLGKAPRMHRDVAHVETKLSAFKSEGLDLAKAVTDVLRHPTVGSKSFLITIGDRSVGGLVSRDQMVGPWQVPVADCGVTTLGFETNRGEAMSMGERTPIAVIDAAAASRMAVGEALTNIAAADVKLPEVKLSLNWMAACGAKGEDAKLFDAVEGASDFCVALGISVPVGKDSLSMRTAWEDNGEKKSVTSPVSLIASAAAPVGDVTLTLTPELRKIPSVLVLADLGCGRARMGGSILAQVAQRFGDTAPDCEDPAMLARFMGALRTLVNEGAVVAYHDRADGGLAATASEMMFASRLGVKLDLTSLTKDADVFAALFNEELGGLMQVPAEKAARVAEVMREAGLASVCHFVGEVVDDDALTISANGAELARLDRADLQKAWTEVSWQIARGRDNPACADSEFARIERKEDTGLFAKTTFDINEDVAAPMILTGVRPKIAILREQGVNSQTEMAAAFTRAGFDAYDVHMTDLLTGRADLAEFTGLACCGGFSYGDVLGAGGGWAKTILHNDRMVEMFRTFFNREDTFGLGICNGCQMMSHLRDLIPGASHWPEFVRNTSEQFEARLVNVEVLESPSIFFAGMAGSVMPVVNSHGEGRVQFLRPEDAALVKAAARFVDPCGNPTEVYPYNPNGSKGGLTSVTTEDGRFTIMMPHPERSHRAQQLSWHPTEWTDASGWMRMFRNARKWVG